VYLLRLVPYIPRLLLTRGRTGQLTNACPSRLYLGKNMEIDHQSNKHHRSKHQWLSRRVEGLCLAHQHPIIRLMHCLWMSYRTGSPLAVFSVSDQCASSCSSTSSREML